MKDIIRNAIANAQALLADVAVSADDSVPEEAIALAFFLLPLAALVFA